MARSASLTKTSAQGASAGWKLALVSPYDFPYPGGVTEHILNLAEQFRRRGHEVHVIAPSSAAPETVQAVPGLHRIGRVVSVPASGSVARITLSPRGYRQVKQLLAEQRFDLIHLHEPLMPALSLAVLRHSHTVNVGTFHAYGGSRLVYFYGKPMLQPFFRKLHGLIAVSRSARDFVGQYFPGDYRIIPNGIAYDHFSQPRPRLPEFDDGRLNVLFVGRLEQRKGLTYLLRAWPEVRARVAGARLIVVGDGRPLPGYRQWAMRQGYTDIVFAGFVSREAMPRYYQSCDVFCAPSTGQESFGIVLLEAMAAGKPIVTTLIPGYREVVEEGVQGVLVPPKDPAALADALVRVLNDEALRKRLGEAGARTARAYAWEIVADQVLDYYGEVLERHASERELAQRRGSLPGIPHEAAHLLSPLL